MDQAVPPGPERWPAVSCPDEAFLPFGGGARRCLGEHVARTYLNMLIPEVLRRRRLEPLARGLERMVLRRTILVRRRSVPIRALAR